jgi:putative transposase
MMYTASEKLAIIRLVEESELSIRRTLQEIKVSRNSFYRWYRAYEERGLDGLENHSRAVRRHWNRIPDSVRELIVEVALGRPDLTPRCTSSDLMGPISPLSKRHFSAHCFSSLAC